MPSHYISTDREVKTARVASKVSYIKGVHLSMATALDRAVCTGENFVAETPFSSFVAPEMSLFDPQSIQHSLGSRTRHWVESSQQGKCWKSPGGDTSPLVVDV
jgi:hypothetical protein